MATSASRSSESASASRASAIDDPDAGADEQLAPVDDDRPRERLDQPLGERGDRERRSSATSHATTNSSPPKRATTSPPRTLARRRSATTRSSSSPAPWPSVSLTTLKRSRSSSSSATSLAVARGGGERLRDVGVQERAVRQAGQRVVQRAAARLGLGVGAVERGGEHVRDRLDEAHVLRRRTPGAARSGAATSTAAASPRVERTGALSPRREPVLAQRPRRVGEAALVLEVVGDDGLVDGERVAGLRAVAARQLGLVAGDAAVAGDDAQRSRRCSSRITTHAGVGAGGLLRRSPRPGASAPARPGSSSATRLSSATALAEAVGAMAVAQVLQLREEVHPVLAVDQRGGEQDRDRRSRRGASAASPAGPAGRRRSRRRAG